MNRAIRFSAEMEMRRITPDPDPALMPVLGTAHLTEPSAGQPLSKRELEVLALLVQRYTNPEIADMLFLSPRTVQTHVAHIFDKLGVSGRRAAAAVAVHRGLV